MPYLKIREDADEVPARPLIMIFTEGTVLGPEYLWELYNHAAYVPIGRCVNKIDSWRKQGAEIVYFTSRRTEKQVREIRNLLLRYHFPGKYLYFRGKGRKYRDIALQFRRSKICTIDFQPLRGGKLYLPLERRGSGESNNNGRKQ